MSKEELTEQIRSDIKAIKNKRGENRRNLFLCLSSRIKRFLSLELSEEKTNTFDRNKIFMLFPSGYYPRATQERHIKTILDTMLKNGFVVEKSTEKIAFQSRRHILRSGDFGSYKLMMAKNGFIDVNYYKFYCNSDGIPIKKLVGTSKLNGLPVDKNGDSVDDWDISILKQTKQRRNQGVFSYGNKSITYEQRRYMVKSYMLIK